MTKLEAVQLLARLGVAPKFSLLGEGLRLPCCCVSRRCRRPSSPCHHPALSRRMHAQQPSGPSSADPPPSPVSRTAVWERLEAENPEFFQAYYQQLEATVRRRLGALAGDLGPGLC